MLMYRLLLCSSLSVMWCLLQNSFTLANLIVGFILGVVVMLILGRLVSGKTSSIRAFNGKRLFHIPNYIVHLLGEVFLANFKVAKLVLMPRLKIKPGIIEFSTEVKGDISLTVLANSITLTPGTWTLFISDDQKILYIHTLDIEHPEQTRMKIKKSLEKYILRIEE